MRINLSFERQVLLWLACVLAGALVFAVGICELSKAMLLIGLVLAAFGVVGGFVHAFIKAG